MATDAARTLDPDIKTLLDQLAAAGGPAMHEMGVEQARAMMYMLRALEGEPDEVASVDDRTIPGPAGDIPVRVYRPAGSATDDTLPILVWYHGGGYVIGDLETADGAARKLANRAGAVVVSVDYRLAPEAPYPAATDDGWAALQWVAANGDEIGGDTTRLAVGGDSAGGNLAACMAVRARNEGAPALRHQLLVYPWLDMTLTSPSIEENAEGYLLTRDGMVWFRDHYMAATDLKDPEASPSLADDLSGVAPATIITAGFDPLRDEGDQYAERLRDAGVAVDHHRYDSLIHGFFGMGMVSPACAAAVDETGSALRAALS
jgi:acetyl esterase